MQQKRKITRQWEVLNRLRKRHVAAESRAAAENARLSDEYQNVTRAFNHLQSKFRHFKAADLIRFEKVCKCCRSRSGSAWRVDGGGETCGALWSGWEGGQVCVCGQAGKLVTACAVKEERRRPPQLHMS